MNTLSKAQTFIALDQFSFHHQLADTQGIAIVMCYKHACGSCKKWQQVLLAYQHLHPAIALFSVDIEKESALAHELELFHLPALYLYTNGQFHCELQAEASLSKLEQAVQTALQAPPSEQP
jgi:thioredoxin-like negative regulator of GroEL